MICVRFWFGVGFCGAHEQESEWDDCETYPLEWKNFLAIGCPGEDCGECDAHLDEGRRDADAEVLVGAEKDEEVEVEDDPHGAATDECGHGDMLFVAKGDGSGEKDERENRCDSIVNTRDCHFGEFANLAETECLEKYDCYDNVEDQINHSRGIVLVCVSVYRGLVRGFARRV